MAQLLDGANVSAQWYYDDFRGGAIFPRLDKFVLHTTETTGWPGYAGGASAPNATYHPRQRAIRQHFPNNVSARALQDPSSTPVRENRDNVFQLEIVAYSDYRLGQSVNGLWIADLTEAHYTDLANMMRQLNRELDLPLRDSVTWKEGQKTSVSGVRLSSSAYDAYRGILGHVHVSGNVHWDPGGFRMSRLRPKLKPEEEDMPVTEEEIKKIALAVWREQAGVNLRAAVGRMDPEVNNKLTAVLVELEHLHTTVDELAAKHEPAPPTP